MTGSLSPIEEMERPEKIFEQFHRAKFDGEPPDETLAQTFSELVQLVEEDRMKICKLKLKNLNSFREPVEIDFENPLLNDASLVAITGLDWIGKNDAVGCDLCRTLRGKRLV